jgi:hypothetical protein
MNLGKEN